MVIVDMQGRVVAWVATQAEAERWIAAHPEGAWRVVQSSASVDWREAAEVLSELA